ncbi:MAG: KilA-N domain-containing protein [Cyanobacteria bacterium P01_F01_bin.56]
MSNISFFVRGVELVEEDGLLSLNVIYKIAGEPKDDDPRRWTRLIAAQRFIKEIMLELNVQKKDILKPSRGKGGGTKAHWKIALAYAAYLDPALYSEILETYKRAKTGDLSLATEVVRRNYDESAVEAFKKDVEEHQVYLDSYWGVHGQLKAHGANDGRQHGAYNAHVNKLAGVEKGKRAEADRRQTLAMRMMQDAGELSLMSSDQQGWKAVKVAKDAGTRIIQALKGN